MLARCIVSAAALCGLLALAATARAQATLAPPLHFDLKPAEAGSPQPGYTGVHEDALFDAAAGFGFDAAPLDGRYGAHPCDDVVDKADDERGLLRGCLHLAPGTRFLVKIAPQTKVRVRVVLASVPHWYGPGTNHYVPQPTRVDDLGVSASKGLSLAVVASDVDLRTPSTKGSLATDVGSYRKLWFTAKSGPDGTLALSFTGPAGAKMPVAAIDVLPFQPAPLAYRRVGATWLSSNAGVVPGLDAFHAHDAAGAAAAFQTIADPLVRADALLWLAGWLDGTETGQVEALDLAQTALADPSLAQDPRAIELRDQLDDYLLARKHLALMNYSFATALPPEGEGYFNANDPDGVFAGPVSATGIAERHYYMAETLLRQVAAQPLAALKSWNAGTGADVDFELSPLAFRAYDQVARIFLGLNATHGYLSGGVPSQDHLDALAIAEDTWRFFSDEGFLANEFAGNSELAMLAWIARPEVHHHSENGGLFAHWDGADVGLAAFDPDKAWWKDLLLADPVDSNAPAWAESQRRYLHSFRSALQWWLDRREQGGEFGGGAGDDPELLGLIALPLVAMQQHSDAAARATLRGAVDHMLAAPSLSDGYWTGTPIDVEHSAEFTTYPLVAGLALSPGDPVLLQRCLDVARHLVSPHAPALPWSALDGSGRRFFESYYCTSAGPPQDPAFASHGVDVPLNAKAILPALLFLGQTDNPTLEADVLSWAGSWRDAALESSGTKPKGLVPASVRLGDHAFGDAGQWWKSEPSGLSYDFPANLPDVAELQGDWFATAHELADSDAHAWLLPMLRLVKALIPLSAAIDGGVPPADLATPGSTNWALKQVLDSQDFWDALALQRIALASDPALRTLDDPDVPGVAPYVDDAFLAAMDALIAQKAGGYAAYLAKPQGPIDVAGGTYGRKGKTNLSASLARGEGWLRNFFPLGTSLVLYTDRAFLFQQSSHETLYGMMTGGSIGLAAPDQVVTWTALEGDDEPLDVSILVNDLATAGSGANPRLRILLYNFADHDRTIGMRLWHRLPYGKYDLRLGKALATTDWFEQGVHSTESVDFDRRGKTFAVALPSRQLTLLELEQTALASFAPSGDLMVGAAETPLELTAGPAVTVRASALNVGSDAGGGEVKATLALDGPDGEPIALAPSGDGTKAWSLEGGPVVLPAIDGYDLPTAGLEAKVALTPPVLKLLALGCTLRVRFAAATPDLDPTNDATEIAIDRATLEALGTPPKFPKVPKQAKKAAKQVAKLAKKL